MSRSLSKHTHTSLQHPSEEIQWSSDRNYTLLGIKFSPKFFQTTQKTVIPGTVGQTTPPAPSATWLSPDSQDQVTTACTVQPLPLCQGPCFGSHHMHLLYHPHPPETLPHLDPRKASFTKWLCKKLWLWGDFLVKTTKIEIFPSQQIWRVGNLVTNSTPLKTVILKFNNKCQLCF